MYLWKVSDTAPVSIETLGAMAVITMIILTSDVTSSAGWWWLFFFCLFVFLFWHLRDVRDYAVF